MDVTWDGTPVAREDPRGSSMVVWRDNNGVREFLVLHRRAAGPPEFEGDWAWTPPAGARQPGESSDAAAARELREETGLELRLDPTNAGTVAWVVYVAQAPPDATVVLDAEHDRFEWLTAARARARCLPPEVGEAIARVDAQLELEHRAVAGS